MTEQNDLIPDLDSEDAFEVQMRGYSRRQVNEFVARSRNEKRTLEDQLSRSLDEVERLRTEVSAARQRELDDKPAHQELSERMSQILRLADDEAKAQKARALDEITQHRNDAKQEIDRIKAEAREQTERMLAAAQEQAENTIATARSEAEKARNSARSEAERTVSDAQKKSETAVAAAQAQAKQMLDEATARATAIHDGAERRLNLLVARHTETVRRLTEVRDVVTNLVAGEAARGSLEEEVARSVASAVGATAGNGAAGGGPRPGGPGDGRHAPGAAPAASRVPADQGAAPAEVPGGATRSHRGNPVPGERPVPGDRPAPPDRPVPADRPVAADRLVAADRPAPAGRPVPADGPVAGDRPAPADRPVPADGPVPADLPAAAGASPDGPARPGAKPVRSTAGRGTLADRTEAPPADGTRLPE